MLATLALVTAGSAAVFSVAAGILWRRLPLVDPERLVALGESNLARGYQNVNAAPANVTDWRERLRTAEDVGFFNEEASELPLALGEGAAVVRVVRVSGNLLSLVGATPIIGRTFDFDDTWAESPPVVVLGYRLWQSAFGADPSVLGQAIRLDGYAYEVRGVLAPEFDLGLGVIDAWVPMRWARERETTAWFRQARVVRPVARLASGATLDQLRDELARLDSDLQIERPETNEGWTAHAEPLADYIAGDRAAAARLFLVAALFLQLLGCANVAAVLLARNVERRRERAVREALGAGRGQTIAASVAESAVLATTGAVGGLLIALAGLRVLDAVRPESFESLGPHLDERLLAFVAAVAAVSSLLAGIWPALGTGQARVVDELAAGGRTSTLGRRQLRAMHAVLAVEIALALTLALGAGALLRGLLVLQNVDIGSSTAGVLAFSVNAPAAIYGEDEKREAMVTTLVDRLSAVPGVTGAAAARHEPLGGFGWTSDFTIESWPVGRFGLDVRHRQMTASYFSTMRVPLIAGRLFEDRPREGRPFEVVVNQAFDDQYFPDGSAVGHRVAFSRDREPETSWHTIVGVVGNERMAVREPQHPEIHGPLMSDMPGIPHVMMRTGTAPLGLAGAVRKVVSGLDSQIAVFDMRTLDDAVARALAPERFTALLLSLFALTGLVLAAVAVHGLTAQIVRLRIDEIRIRKILGATDASVGAATIRPILLILTAGLALGMAGAAAVQRVAETFWLGAAPLDFQVVVWAGSWVTVAAAAGLAGPLGHAIRVSPMEGV